MPFPISLSGTVVVHGLAVEQALDRLECALAKAKAAALRRDDRSLLYRGGMFRLVSNWNILGPVTRGTLDVSARGDGVCVAWKVTFGQLLFVATIAVAVIASMAPRQTPADEALVWLGVWVWIFGGNFVITRWRYPRFLIRSLQSDGQNVTSA